MLASLDKLVDAAFTSMMLKIDRPVHNCRSFHTDNVEDLVREQAWKPPKKPCAAPLSLTATTAFGAALRQHFLIDFHTWTFINHGAFGAALREAHAEAAAWRLRCEEQPLSFLDRCAANINDTWYLR